MLALSRRWQFFKMCGASAILLLTHLDVCLNAAHAQSVKITARGLQSDDKTIALRTRIGGDGSDHEHLGIWNASGGNIRYQVTLDDLTSAVLRFHKEDNGGKHEDLDVSKGKFTGDLNTTDDTGDTFPVYIYLRAWHPATYKGTVQVDAWDLQTKQHLGTAKIAVEATFDAPLILKNPPKGYDMWRTKSGELQRCRPGDLPLRVYSNDAGQQQMAERAVDIWNAAGYSIGLKKGFFKLVKDRDDADFAVDWSGKDRNGKDLKDQNTLGQASLLLGGNGAPSVIPKIGIVMRKDKDAGTEGEIAETLLQELGHILGLEHSDNKADIMYAKDHRHPKGLRLSQVYVTNRDLEAVWWLYSQKDFVPIVPKR